MIILLNKKVVDFLSFYFNMQESIENNCYEAELFFLFLVCFTTKNERILFSYNFFYIKIMGKADNYKDFYEKL